MGIAHAPGARNDMDLVKETQALLDTLRRLHVMNDGVMFWNREKTVKFMLRNDPVDADTLACELVIVFEDDDETMNRIVDLSNLGCLEEPGMYVIHNWSYPLETVAPPDVEPAMHAINRAYHMRVCPCAAAFIHDDAALCLLCQLTSTAEDRASHFCSICCEDGMHMHMKLVTCCKQYLHATCLKTWYAKSDDSRCPLCRAPQ